jgi:hypothetical protein
MEAIKIVLAGVGCLGLLLIGSCTFLGMAGAQMIDKAVEIEKAKEAARRDSGADSSRFGAASRYESASSYSPEKTRTNMDRSDWKFGDPNADPNKR